ncbi:hypothetical protein FLAG1_08382 [Fusarium langsethiae]|uniref:Xylanolytic transcriptional activator regulatory domain-containing protein n=1 Tax=Fusarium langsethiae TaxID=179993 RepID=A0A0M9ES97_FUSLA|nr:hypothetical protein FLAG1_08382 [Fusarium langsethiae]GKU05534.1 unnamed protein product [Fusarium langsethiae]
MSTVGKNLSQQDGSRLSDPQVPPNSDSMAQSSVDCLIPGMASTATATSQLDTLAMASMLLSQRAPPAASPRQSLEPELMDTIVVQPDTLSTERRSSSHTQHSSDLETSHQLDSHPHMTRDHLLSQTPGRFRQQDRVYDESGRNYQSAAMEVDSGMSNIQRLSGLDDGFPHPDTEATTDILDFLHHGTDTDMLNMMVDFSLPFSLSSITGNVLSSSEDRMRSVPDERFDLVSRLWPRGWDLGTGSFATTDIRRDMISTIKSSPRMPNPFSNIATGTQNTEWTIDSLRLQDLWQEFDPDSFHAQQEQQQQVQQQDFPGARHRESPTTVSGSDGGDSAAFDGIFQSTRILNLGIAVALRQPHFLLSFVHRSTFVAQEASNLFVFSLCLLGLILLDSGKVKRHVQIYLPAAIRRCCARLAKPDFRPGASKRLISDLGSATLLLGAMSLCPHMVAQLAGLFTPQSAMSTTEELLDQVPQSNNLPNINESQDLRWKTWARLEELKRLTALLFITDAWWSYRLGSTPRIPTSAVQYDLPCATEVFRSPSARLWSHLLESGAKIDNQPLVLHLHAPWPKMTANRDVSPVGILGLLSIIWARILDTRWRVIPWPLMGVEALKDFTIPIDNYAAAKPGDMFGPSLRDIYSNHSEFLLNENPSCIAMWHFINLQLLVNKDVFEIAAGRTNVEEAHSALRLIASWSKTKAARRACLHAAGIYKAMGRRRINDDMMLHSEASMFLAALVLGLYIFMVPRSGDVDDINPRERTTEPLEILDNVDWTKLGLAGFGSHASNETDETQNESVESPASYFISQDIPIRFMGTVCEGGYDGARMVLLEFAHLMGDLSKGNPDCHRQILKAMTDSLIDLEVDI